MKRIVVLSAAFLLATGAAHAQQNDSTQTAKRGFNKEHHMHQDVNLTAEQKVKMETLRADFKKQREAINAQKLTADERKAAVQKLAQQHKAAVDALLTPEQKAKMQQKHTQRRDGMKGHRKGKSMRDDKRSGDGVMKDLNLSADQQAKIKAIRENYKPKQDALRNDNSLTQADRRAKMQALMQSQRTEIHSVLTKEQQEKWEAHRNQRASR